jgi:hypothetical protein
MNKYNLNNNHPLIPNQNQYICEKKYISIHSIDRDNLKYPNASLFEIELPQDYLNVETIRLHSWSFPANYSVFNSNANNLIFVFKFTDIYNPSKYGYNDPLQNAIYAGLDYQLTNYYDYVICIEDGFYNPSQMAIELKNKMNAKVTEDLVTFFKNNEDYKYALELFTGYNEFEVVYNSVGQKLWFGNKSSGFELINDSCYYIIDNYAINNCINGQRVLPSFYNWGLPSYLGFTRCPEKSICTSNPNDYRFFYLELNSGLWITPSTLPYARVHYLSAPLKINFMGPSYIYMELDSNSSLNCIDETEPFQIDKLSLTTNQTNGIVNSAFAKIPIPTTPISQWFDNEDITPYKWFDPPMERIRKVKVKMRYHDGTLVDFSGFDYSFMLELSLLSPQIGRNANIKKMCGVY